MKIIASLLRMIYLMIHPRVPLKVKLIPIIGILYLFWPRDILMDFTFAIGFFDDLIVLMLLTSIFVKMASRKLNQRQDPKNGTKVVDAKYQVISKDDKENTQK